MLKSPGIYILFLFVSTLSKWVLITSKKSDWLVGRSIVPTTIDFVFGSNVSKKIFSISGGKQRFNVIT